ncbi:MAG: tetratricopeptide repeat protein [Rhizobiaceae bacterium]|nr:tetratricopeptide repeat protein [Rhizobiaceae bacterium]
MRRLLRAVALAALFAATIAFAPPAVVPATAQEDAAAVRERLFERLLRAPTEADGRAAEDAIWRFWMAQGPTAEIRKDIDRAMARRSAYDFAGAKAILDRVVEVAPGYAEGWNQRAFILFLQDELDESLADIDRALALEPRHFGALSGRAHVLMRQGRMELGQKALREAVAIHPWLKERSMLIPVPGGPETPPVGQGI